MKRKLQILFITAGGRAHGKHLAMGHIYRCINLAKELQPNKIYFLLEDFGGAKKAIEENGFDQIKLIKQGTDFAKDVNTIISCVKKNRIDVVIVDHFHVREYMLRKLRKFTKVVVITDLNKKEISADLLVNGFIGYKNRITRNKFNTKCLLGPKYQIINKDFTKRQSYRKKYDLLLTFGGFDERGITNILLESLVKHLSKIKVKIIVGPAALKTKKMQYIEKKYAKNLNIIKNSNKMYYEIVSSKFGVCTGGITTYEFVASKVPFAIICDDTHQLLTAKEWHRRGIALNFGLINKCTYKKFDIFLDDLVNKKIRLKTSSIIDGYGARRVSHEILKMV